MPELDGASAASLEGDFAPAIFIFADIVGDPIRVWNGGSNVTPSGTGDSDLDGHTFVAFGHQVITVGDVANSESGSDTFRITLSGVTGVDSLLADIEDETKWLGQLVRVWFQPFDSTGATPLGDINALKTGYASSVEVDPAAAGTTIVLEVETYLASDTDASNRSYLNQGDYDAADTSASATLAAANMGRGSATTGGTGGSMAGGSSTSGGVVQGGGSGAGGGSSEAGLGVSSA